MRHNMIIDMTHNNYHGAPKCTALSLEGRPSLAAPTGASYTAARAAAASPSCMITLMTYGRRWRLRHRENFFPCKLHDTTKKKFRHLVSSACQIVLTRSTAGGDLIFAWQQPGAQKLTLSASCRLPRGTEQFSVTRRKTLYSFVTAFDNEATERIPAYLPVLRLL